MTLTAVYVITGLENEEFYSLVWYVSQKLCILLKTAFQQDETWRLLRGSSFLWKFHMQEPYVEVTYAGAMHQEFHNAGALCGTFIMWECGSLILGIDLYFLNQSASFPLNATNINKLIQLCL